MSRATTERAGWQLRVREGHAVLVHPGGVEFDPGSAALSANLVAALHQWAEVCASVAEEGEQDRAAAASRRGRLLAERVAAEVGAELVYRDPIRGRAIRVGGAPPRSRGRGPAAAAPAEPTPWGTGLVVSGIVGALVAVTLVIMTSGLAEVSPLLSVLVNVAVAAGLAPSVWIGRRTPVWRWVAFGTGAGIGAAWVALLLGLLG